MSEFTNCWRGCYLSQVPAAAVANDGDMYDVLTPFYIPFLHIPCDRLSIPDWSIP